MNEQGAIVIHDDIDAHVEDLVAQEHLIKESTRATRAELNRIARDKAIHIHKKRIEYVQEYKQRGEPMKAAPAWLGWCKEVAKVNRSMAGYSNRAGGLLCQHKFFVGQDIGVSTLATIAEKKLTNKEMTAFKQFMITQDKPVTRAKVHKWAHDTCGKPMPNHVETEVVTLAPVTSAQTMAGRLSLGWEGRALLGITPATPTDVVGILCKVWAQRYHPDKGASVEDSQRVLAAIESVKGTMK